MYAGEQAWLEDIRGPRGAFFPVGCTDAHAERYGGRSFGEGRFASHIHVWFTEIGHNHTGLHEKRSLFVHAVQESGGTRETGVVAFQAVVRSRDVFGQPTVFASHGDIHLKRMAYLPPIGEEVERIDQSFEPSGPRVEGSDEGEILAVLEEKNSLVGTMHRMEGRLKFVPDDCPAISMQVMRDCEGSAKDGDKVAVEILLRGSRQEDHRVGVAMRFGSCDEAKRCAKALLYAQDIRNRFPDKVRDEAKKLDNAEVSAADCEGRMDLRALPIFTIDSAETKDIDDAISLTKTPDGGFELGVHIADVSNYVKPGSELDNEAFNRATSVYYADQVVPMLPKQLSNGICSLNEGVLRLAFSCLMRLDKDGNLTDYRFVKSVIRSRVKGVYSEINALLAGSTDDELTGKYHEVLAQLPAMKELYGHRARLRKERGCMDIESGEVKLILDEDGHCIDVKKRTSGESEAMIEEFMLLANQCAAHFARVKHTFLLSILFSA